MRTIIRLFAEKIISGEKTLDNVPEQLKEEVIEAIEELKPIYTDDGK